MWKVITASPFLLLGGHSAFVYYHNSNIAKKAQSEVDFRPGSTNDMMLDFMNSGDIILVRRKWYYNYFPVAVSILLYRAVTQSEFDHLGVVALDKLGNPWIIENTPFEGMKCSKLADQLKGSSSEIMTLVPLMPRPEKPVTIEKVHEWTNRMKEMPDEVTALTKFSTSVIWQNVFGRNSSVSSRESAEMNTGLCPNAQLLKENFDQLNIRVNFLVDMETEYATIKTIEDRQVQLKSKDQRNKTRMFLSPEHVLLQTR